MRKRSGSEVFRITGARSGLADDVRARQRRYAISMSIRTVSVILTIVLWNIERPVAWAMLVVGAVLPYVAVVIANAGRENIPPPPETTYVPPPSQPAIEPSRVETGTEREARESPYVPEDELLAGDEDASPTGEGTGPTRPEAAEAASEPVSGAAGARARERGGEPVA
ncbi:DUF3099 domain-containing protein [Actinacidiphila yeochonensis]|uniref:DUF3099 domain-containing protein n=1 Tax=Actinacidiphila yeochonensis TaxID=89050 RepID=UPI00099CDE5C|nr:DUF3099 domain-containing protein [Actinacidiphila yeochonensis]